LVYIPPKNLNVDADTLNKMLVVNDTESNNPNLKNQYGSTMHKIEELMRVFSGINDSNAPIGNPTLYDFYNSNTNLSSTQIESLKSTKITPYVRAGGSLTSGTASSFVNESHLTFKKTDLSKQQQKAFDNGNYGTAYGLQQTDEANSRA
jgi:hypothetical protein